MVSPKWQTMWRESQHCSKGIANLPLPSQQANKILEDLKTSCCSPNKAVQVEALKCWGLWIQNQNHEDWKLNTICFTAVRPLITKKLQPLHKDVDICKMKLSLMWALLVKVQDIMHLEGPQYILEVFLQSCLTWLSSGSVEDSEKDISPLIFQLLLSVLDKNEALAGCDKEVFPPLSSNVLHIKKVFHLVADKFLNLFIYWRKIKDKSIILKIWRHFLEYCEKSYEHIPIPVWHKVFKLAGQICAEKNEPVKERLAFLHSCATTLKSALSSSKFIDFGNLLTTPCEVLLKKLVELCTVECDEFRDSEMFLHSKEICEVLSKKSVAINGYDLCISVLDVLEEFCLRSLFWGVWCGLVYCYKSFLMGTHQNQLTKIEMKFYRKLRGFVVNFELDRKDLDEDCIKEVERHIALLNISCFCSYSSVESVQPEEIETRSEQTKLKENFVLTPPPKCVFNGVSNKIVPVTPTFAPRLFILSLKKKKHLPPRKTFNVHFDLSEVNLGTLSINCIKSLPSSTFTSRLIINSMRTPNLLEILPRALPLPLSVDASSKKNASLAGPCHEERAPSPKPPCTPVKKTAVAPSDPDDESDVEEECISTPTTRSKKRAEEEKKKELEMQQKRRKRKSFEVLVQEIVRKNKERKTEKNDKRGKNQDGLRSKRIRRKSDEEKQKVNDPRRKRKKSPEVPVRKLRNSKKEEEPKIKKKKEKKANKTEGKLENYFKVIRKKSVSQDDTKKPAKKGKKGTIQSSCEKREKNGQRKGEIGWRQTSLKTMMSQKSKVDKVKQGARTREKIGEVAEEKPKARKDIKKPPKRPLPKERPFKEFYHDHEYAKMKPPETAETTERVAAEKKTKKAVKRQLEKKPRKTDVKSTSKRELSVTKPLTETTVLVKPQSAHVEALSKSEESKPRVAEVLEEPNVQKVEIPEATKCRVKESLEVDEELRKPILEDPEESLEDPNSTNDTRFDEYMMELSEIESIFDRTVKKRARELEILEPNKRTKLDEEILEPNKGKKLEEGILKPNRKTKLEEEFLELNEIKLAEEILELNETRLEEESAEDLPLPLEVTEKENLEEKQPESVSPMKKEKVGCLISKYCESPKSVSGGMSRALRIIGLVPESTMGRSWETSPRTEALKCLKAPNVDKNSRASKMLALLSGNLVEVEEAVKTSEEEIISGVAMVTTPNAKTPTSSMKSPKSIKKRRSIRFDDAKNETVLYQTDTPPSQILEERGKLRGSKPFEIVLPFP